MVPPLEQLGSSHFCATREVILLVLHCCLDIEIMELLFSAPAFYRFLQTGRRSPCCYFQIENKPTFFLT